MRLVNGIMIRSVMPLPKSLQLALLQDHNSKQSISASFADVAQSWVHHSDLGVQVMRLCESRGVTIRVATEKLIAEEAPESYKDVSQV